MYILHRNKTCPTITDAKKRFGCPPKVERPFKKDAEDQLNSRVNETPLTMVPDDSIIEEISFTEAPPVTKEPEDTKCLCKEDCKENCILDVKDTSSVINTLNTKIENTETSNQQLKEENEKLSKENKILKLRVTSLSNDLSFERDNLKDTIKKKRIGRI